MRQLLIALPLLLAGCGLFGDRASPDGIDQGAETPLQSSCRAEAQRTPELRALSEQFNPNNSYNVSRITEERNRVISRAYRDCLRRNGESRGSGVEPIQRR